MNTFTQSLLLSILLVSLAHGQEYIYNSYEPEVLEPEVLEPEIYDARKPYDSCLMELWIGQRNWDAVYNVAEPYGIDTQKVKEFYNGELVFPKVGKPEFFNLILNAETQPVDKAQYNLIEILQAKNPDFPFVPTDWGQFPSDEIVKKPKAVFLQAKLENENMPVALYVGYSRDGSSDALIKAMDGSYDWLTLAFNHSIWKMRKYDWHGIKKEWDNKTGGKPIGINGIWIKDRNTQAVYIEDMDNRLIAAGFAFSVYYETH